MTEPPPRPTISRYELLDEIGRGNMGVVYRARDPAMERTVAVKIVRLGFSLDDVQRTRFLARFQREARIAGKLDHPNIVSVHDFGSGSEPFLVMEYFDGVSLQKLQELGALPPEEVELILRQLASALAYAHRRGVVHRDVKPANVLYRAGVIKLVDFGIARLETSELTATGEFIGTPSYMAPEVFSGQAVDGRSDLFSLGVVLYQLLTGSKPFEGGSVSRTMYRVLHEEPVPPSRLVDGLSTDWDVVSRKLLAKNRDERYSSAEALVEDLDRMRSGVPLSLPAADEPTEPASAFSAASSRRRRLLALGAVALALGFGLLVSGRAPTIPEAVPGSTPLPSLEFVARHEHGIGHCTGDLELGEDGIVFETTRHRPWRWRWDEVTALHRRSDTEIELVASSPEDSGGEASTFRFTFLRPAFSEDDFRRYSDRWSDRAGSGE